MRKPPRWPSSLTPERADALGALIEDRQKEPGWPSVRLPAGRLVADLLTALGWSIRFIKALLSFDHSAYTQRVISLLHMPPSADREDGHEG